MRTGLCDEIRIGRGRTREVGGKRDDDLVDAVVAIDDIETALQDLRSPIVSSCFGTADPSRAPRPAAAMTAERGGHPLPQIRPAHLPHQQRRDRRLSVAIHRMAAVRAPRARPGARTSWCRSRSTARRSTNCSTPTSRPTRRRREYLASRAEPVEEIRTSEDVVDQCGRPRTLRAVLPGLHAQAMGPRPERARQVGDRRASRRGPTPTTAISATSSRRCRATAIRRCSSAMLDHPLIDVRTRHRLSRHEGRDRSPTTSSTPARSTNISTSASASCRIAACSSTIRRSSQERFQPVAVVNYPERGRALHADHRVQASDRAGAPRRPASPTNIRRRRAILIIRSRGRRIRSCSSNTRRLPTRPPGVTFVGRLATYRYYNMDQIVGQALATFRRIDAAQSRKLRRRRHRVAIAAARSLLVTMNPPRDPES